MVQIGDSGCPKGLERPNMKKLKKIGSTGPLPKWYMYKNIEISEKFPVFRENFHPKNNRPKWSKSVIPAVQKL